MSMKAKATKWTLVVICAAVILGLLFLIDSNFGAIITALTAIAVGINLIIKGRKNAKDT